MSKDSNNNSTSQGITATSIEETDLEEEKRRKTQPDVIHIGSTKKLDTVHIGGKNSNDIADITSAPPTSSNEKNKQQETNGGGAILGAATGVGLGIAAGLAMGPLAPIAVPALAIAGYFAGMYAGNTIEAGMRGLSEGTFTDRIKDFVHKRLESLDRTIGGTLGLVIGGGLSLMLGPIAPMAAPFLAFYGNRIGAEIGEMAIPPIIEGWQKFKKLFQQDIKSVPEDNNTPQQQNNKKQYSNDISAISLKDREQAENIIKNTELSDNISKTSLPNARKQESKKER
ncbi:hypothetical protein NOVO_02710 [Rickettsiales bacterium Ac37b]|nr:hypothetical protein NOVO_02710 [Rickettsiales bacterium Ac37b]